MTTIQDIINFLKKESSRSYQPSMDGRREAYYNGMKDAYLRCVSILENFLKQGNND